MCFENQNAPWSNHNNEIKHLVATVLRFISHIKRMFKIKKTFFTRRQLMSEVKHDSAAYWKANVRLILGSLFVWAISILWLWYYLTPFSGYQNRRNRFGLLVCSTGFYFSLHRFDFLLFVENG